MAATLRLEIVTPDARAFSDDVEMVVLPAVEGEMGVLPMHVPLVTQIHAGELVHFWPSCWRIQELPDRQ